MNDATNGRDKGGDPKAEAELSKALAEESTAKATELKARQELLEAKSPLAKSLQEAETQKAIAEASQQAAEAQQKQLSALLPDLSKVTPGSLETKGEQPLFGAALAQRAAAAAATQIARLVREAITELGSARILVTSDTELATSDAIYVEVMTGLDQLNTAAESLVGEVQPVPAELPRHLLPTSKAASLAFLPAIGAVANALPAVAAAIPGALSLISAHRSLSTSTVTVDSLAAAAVVAGKLSQGKTPPGVVIHDNFRLLPEGGVVQTKLATLADHRQALIGRKIALEDEKATENVRLTELKEKVKDLSKQLETTSSSQKEPVQAALEQRSGEVANCERKLSEDTVRIGLIDSTTGAIDKFTASLQMTGAGAARSPLAAAVLREQLHSPAAGAEFTHVLLVKAEPGSAQQLIDDRPLAFKDRFSTIATSNVTYMLIETRESKIIRAGSAGGEAKINGKIGGDFAIQASALATEM